MMTVLILEYRRADVAAIRRELQEHNYDVIEMRDFPSRENPAGIPPAHAVLAGDVFHYAREYFSRQNVPAAFFSSFANGQMHFADTTLNSPMLSSLKSYSPSEAVGVMLGGSA